MNILLTIHHHLDPNAGAAGITLKLGQEYQKAGHRVSYFSFDNLSSKLPEIIKAIIFPYWVTSRLLFQKQSIDVIDASTGDAWLWAKLCRRFRPNTALITRSHGLEHSVHLENLAESARGNLSLSWKYPLYHGGYRLWEVKTSIKNADLTLMSNSRDRDYAYKELGITLEKLAIMPNGVPEEFINLPWESTYGVHTSPDQLQNTESSPPSPPSLGGTRFESLPELASDPAPTKGARERTRWNLGGKNLRDETQETYVYTVGESTPQSVDTTIGIAQIGSFIERKGIKYSIPALNYILQRFDNVKVSFLGTGCAASKVMEDFSPDIRHKITVVPSYNHQVLPDLLKGHQIKLSPSLSEGFSLALIEAMACGLVPITSSTLGLTEFLEDGKNGILIPPRNSQAIEEALEELIRDRSQLDCMRRNAYQTAQNYSWTSIAQKNLELYRQVLQSKKVGNTIENRETVS